MKDQVLTIEQMQELISMGIDVSNASMCWNYNDEKSYWALVINYTHSPYIEGEIVPTFTLQDILNIIQSAKCLKPGCLMTLAFCEDKNYITPNIYDPGSHRSYGETPLEAAFEMLKWCKQNNYI